MEKLDWKLRFVKFVDSLKHTLFIEALKFCKISANAKMIRCKMTNFLLENLESVLWENFILLEFQAPTI